MPSSQQIIPVSENSQVGEARRVATRLAQAAGLDETSRGQVAIVATELATNLVRHSSGGRLVMRVFGDEKSSGVEILSIDSGPGISNIVRSLEDGYSTGGTPGNGLGAVKRLSQTFDIYSEPGGTVIVSRIGPEPKPSMPQWGVVCAPIKGELECGDSWAVIEQDQRVSVMIADGLGHGPLAAAASIAAVQIFQKEAAHGPARFLEAAHHSLRSTRGAAIAAAQFELSNREIQYAGVGNISGHLQAPTESRGLFSHNGTVGLEARKFQQFVYSWIPSALLIMHSDGLNTRWDLSALPGLFPRHPAVIAGVLFRDFARGRDDVTVLVMR